MQPFPQEFLEAWHAREPLAAFATGDSRTPNVIWVSGMHLDEDGAMLMIADNFMAKTRANIDAGSVGALVMIALPRRAYQLRGGLSYHDSGPVYEQMKQGWLDASFPGRGTVAMTVDEVFCGAERIWTRNG